MDLNQYSFAQLVRLLKHLRGGSIGFDAHRDERTRTKDLLMAYITANYLPETIEQAIVSATLKTADEFKAAQAAHGGSRAQVAHVEPAALEPEPQAPTKAVASVTGSPNVTSAAMALAQALAAMQPQAAPLDEARVLELIAANAPKPRMVTIEIKRPDVAPLTLAADKPRHKIFPTVLRLLAAGENVFLVGPAGTGKTTLAEQCAEALGRPFRYTSRVGNEYKLRGYLDPRTGQCVRTAYRETVENGGVFLWDEMDGSDESATIAFNADLENGHCDFPDSIVKRHADCVFIGAGNTYGTGATRKFRGRNPLDGAFLDRFSIVDMDYDEDLEVALSGNAQWAYKVQAWRKAAAQIAPDHIIGMRAVINGAKLLAAGFSTAEVERFRVFKGLPDDTVQRIKREAC